MHLAESRTGRIWDHHTVCREVGASSHLLNLTCSLDIVECDSLNAPVELWNMPTFRLQEADIEAATNVNNIPSPFYLYVMDFYSA